MSGTFIKHLLVVLVAVLSIATLVGIGAKPKLNGSVPVEISLQPAQPGPNERVQITVVLDQPAVGEQPVAIGCTDPYAFVDLPSEVYVPDGEWHVSFEAFTSTYYHPDIVLTATCNSGSDILIVDTPDGP